MNLLDKLKASSALSFLKGLPDFSSMMPRFNSRPRTYMAKKGNYVLHKISTDGKRAMYRHPTKKGPGRRIIVNN